MTQNWQKVFEDLMALAAARKNANAAESYTARLLQGDEDALLKKLVEEAGESALAAKGGDAARLTSEMADLFFHCFVTMTRYGVTLQQVADELTRRRGMSGLTEKAARKADNRHEPRPLPGNCPDV